MYDVRVQLHHVFPSYGPAWDAAIEYGVDVSLIEENLRLTPTERLRKLQDLIDFFTEIQTAREAAANVQTR